MTYDPYRNGASPQDPNGNFNRDPDTGSGMGILLVLTLLVIGGFIYYFSSADNTRVATNEMRPPITQQQSTTGSAPRSDMRGSTTAPSATPAPAETTGSAPKSE